MVAMSGGVDSSVAAYLLKQQGYECIGCTMKLYDNEDIGVKKGHTCCSLSDVEDARSVAYRLGMPYYVFNYMDSFRKNVVDKFVSEYMHGRTPNPCIDCNRYMKFDLLYQKAKILGCDYIATGHYATVKSNGETYSLYKGADRSKDQSYVLYQLTQDQLAHTLFPLGEYNKTEVRKIAEENGFLNAEKPDSQDICFVPDGDYAKVIERFSEKYIEPGNFVDNKGTVLGRHKGIIHYTVGQRKGLGISFGAPLYVCKIRPESNEVVLGEKSELTKNIMFIKDVNWIFTSLPEDSFRCRVKIRYRSSEFACIVYPLNELRAKICFEEPAIAITPGQSAVLYKENSVLGGGIIE